MKGLKKEEGNQFMGCKTTGKKSFDTKKKAEKRAKQLNVINYKNNDKTVLRAYLCHCGSYHLTSKPKYHKLVNGVRIMVTNFKEFWNEKAYWEEYFNK
jgi:hypothetical protein